MPTSRWTPANKPVYANCCAFSSISPIEQAEADADRLISLQHITRQLNEHYDHAMKVRVVEMMWQMVYADGEKDHYEEHLIRQVAELLYVPHGEFIQARHKAEDAAATP